MREYITFRELLNLIYDKKSPKCVEYYGKVYQKGFVDYVNCLGERLSGKMRNIDEMVGTQNIIICNEILDDKEKEYLKAFIKPFRNRVRTIERKNNKEWERIVVFYKDYDDTSDSVRSYMSLPMFEAGTMYKGMELNKEYTVEELGL